MTINKALLRYRTSLEKERADKRQSLHIIGCIPTGNNVVALTNHIWRNVELKRLLALWLDMFVKSDNFVNLEKFINRYKSCFRDFLELRVTALFIMTIAGWG